jgi:ppGpp synthetase/RelA/SpoT-type nucleotidyltranferase
MPTDLEKLYGEKLPLIKAAERALFHMLNDVAASIQDRRLVRAEVRPPRIKSLASLEAKAQGHGWSAEETFDAASDLVGGRVVCNNVEDVYRFCEMLKLRLVGTDCFEIEDHIQKPRAGYRALHVNVHLRVGEYPSLEAVPVEIQIRTRLQDAWAELVHEDIYKNQDLPDDLRAMAEALATMLEATDKIASDIRTRVTRRALVAEKFDPSKVTPEGLAFVFAEVFGNAPADYVAQEAMGVAKSVGLTSLEPLQKAFAQPEFRERLGALYRKYLRLPADPTEIFLACIVAAAKGDRHGLAWIGKRAKREAEEMQAIYEREALSNLPETIDELLESPTAYIDENVANALGGTEGCAICGEVIFLPDTIAEGLVRHYGLSDDTADKAYQAIEEAIRVSDLETGGWDSTSLCSYHADRLDKD